jgi:hypothetical protein
VSSCLAAGPFPANLRQRSTLVTRVDKTGVPVTTIATTNHAACDSLEPIDGRSLASVTGGGKNWDRIKNSWKTAANAATHYENAVLPDQIGVGPVAYNIGKIPTPFKDDPFKKWRQSL